MAKLIHQYFPVGGINYQNYEQGIWTVVPQKHPNTARRGCSLIARGVTEIVPNDPMKLLMVTSCSNRHVWPSI